MPGPLVPFWRTCRAAARTIRSRVCFLWSGEYRIHWITYIIYWLVVNIGGDSIGLHRIARGLLQLAGLLISQRVDGIDAKGAPGRHPARTAATTVRATH